MTEMPQEKPRRPVVGLPDILGIAAGLTLLFFLVARHHRYFPDDTFITLRYARNLAEHGQLAWNLGELTEGYSSALHVLMLAGMISTGMAPESAAFALATGSTLLLLFIGFCTARLILREPKDASLRSLCWVAFAATPALAVWTAGGLETMLNAALMSGGLYFVLRLSLDRSRILHACIAGTLFSLAILTRQDNAPVIAAVALVTLLVPGWGRGRRLLIATILAGLPAGVALVHMAVRLSVYGLAFPLPFYAKTGLPLSLRLSNSLEFMASDLIWLPILVTGIAAALVLVRRSASFATLIGAISLLSQLIFVTWAGGDHMLAGRLIITTVYSSLILILELCRIQPRRIGLAFSTVAVAATLLSAGTLRTNMTDGAGAIGKMVANHIEKNWPAGSVIALHTAGSTPFFASDMVYIDMLGLNDPHIATRSDIPLITAYQHFPGHAKGDGAYVLSRRPDFIISGLAEGSPVEEKWFLSDVELAQSPEFARCYRRETAEIAYDRSRITLLSDNPYPLIFTYYRRICG
ncbi:hypothetical protein OU426_02825 [Frigidibacter sp. RF13]|uniref:hypothetical protein n=1 Tax=Frigidibacter sp. RF13 TaxID=2997340 RepID=UPI00226F4D2F|nr:hypothetical protein [Frigidibacter sp. RF13]MCY1125776.1 hypothetical protein [Frigidibacter sp. RF13]